MDRIAKMNFWGLSMTTAALLASSAFLVGCGQPPSASSTSNPATGSFQSPLTTPNGTPIPQVVAPVASNGIADLGQFPAAHVASLLGTYGGTIHVYDEDFNDVDQAYALTVRAVTMANQGSRQFAEISFASGNVAFKAVAQIQSTAYPSGNTSYIFATFPQPVTSISQSSQVILQLMLTLDRNNVFDPASSMVRVGTVAGGFYQDAVDFNGDLAKR